MREAFVVGKRANQRRIIAQRNGAQPGTPLARPEHAIRQGIGQLQHVNDRAADGVLRRDAADSLRGAIERQHKAFDIRRRQAAREAVDDVLTEGLQVGQLIRRGRQLFVRAPDALGEVAAQDRHREEPEDVQADGKDGNPERRQRVVLHDSRKETRAVILRQHEPAVQQRAQHRDHHAAAPRLNRARGDDRERRATSSWRSVRDIMIAETITASHPSCTSTSQRFFSEQRAPSVDGGQRARDADQTKKDRS